MVGTGKEHFEIKPGHDFGRIPSQPRGIVEQSSCCLCNLWIRQCACCLRDRNQYSCIVVGGPHIFNGGEHARAMHPPELTSREMMAQKDLLIFIDKVAKCLYINDIEVS